MHRDVGVYSIAYDELTAGLPLRQQRGPAVHPAGAGFVEWTTSTSGGPIVRYWQCGGPGRWPTPSDRSRGHNAVSPRLADDCFSPAVHKRGRLVPAATAALLLIRHRPLPRSPERSSGLGRPRDRNPPTAIASPHATAAIAPPRFRSRGRSRSDDCIEVSRSRRSGHLTCYRALVWELRAVRRTRSGAARGLPDRGPLSRLSSGDGEAVVAAARGAHSRCQRRLPRAYAPSGCGHPRPHPPGRLWLVGGGDSLNHDNSSWFGTRVTTAPTSPAALAIVCR
jgi:hypothetical protein